MQRNELAVDVGKTNLVVVKHIDGADARAGDCLRGKATYPADAEDRNAGNRERLHRRLTKQQLRAGKFVEHEIITFLFVPFRTRKS